MFEKNKHAVERVTKPVLHRSEEDAEVARAMWNYRIQQLRGRFGGCVLYNTEYITEAERPAIEEKKRLETERQKAIVYKQSDTELSRHINFNE
jgi:Pyruvate/2-oxoacid:ferredoxin oxidoreductase gamma subunit